MALSREQQLLYNSLVRTGTFLNVCAQTPDALASYPLLVNGTCFEVHSACLSMQTRGTECIFRTVWQSRTRPTIPESGLASRARCCL